MAGADWIACHIGSQLTDSNPVIEAVREVVHLAEELKRIGIPLKDIDVGGGLGTNMIMKVRLLLGSGCLTLNPVCLHPFELK